MPMDDDFVLAMEHGFPPMAGVGIGIDRLVAILCGQDNIKEAVLFPLMRPQG
jgi:lysyl-tRNA synthetase class 2